MFRDKGLGLLKISCNIIVTVYRPNTAADQFCILGNCWSRGKFHFAQGMWVPLGIEENPLVIRPREREGGDTTKEYSFVTNEFRFCCSAEFAYGRRYQFATHGGTEENPYSLALGDGKVTPLAAWASDYNASFSYDPSRSGPGDIWIVEGSTNAAVASAAKFSLTYRLVPVRPIAQHDLVRPEPLTAGESVECRPGRINATDGKYYDLIFDDCLLKVSLVKGKRYVLDTVGAQANLLLFVYDARGNVLYESESDGTDTGNVRCAFVSPYTFDCYVGLAEKLADDDLDDDFDDFFEDEDEFDPLDDKDVDEQTVSDSLSDVKEAVEEAAEEAADKVEDAAEEIKEAVENAAE